MNFKTIFIILLTHQLVAVLRADTEYSCEIETDTSFVKLSVNETWKDSGTPCRSTICVLDDFDIPRVRILEQECNITCEEGFELKIPPNECCGTCIKNSCIVNGKTYSHHDIWKDPDNCTIHECEEDTDGDLFITTFKKNCPPLGNCSADNIVTRDCCQYCTARQESNTIKSSSLISTKENSISGRVLSLLEQESLDFTSADTYIFHPCLRDCVEGESQTCYYEFIIEEYETLSKACFDCPFNVTDCFRPHCIAGDGFRRNIMVVNRMMPGPSIEVCQGDTIVVDVRNALMSEATTIHWHGLHMKKTPYMDGVPHIAQCPITPGHSFRYVFEAENSGTHFWHSHIGMQRGDGVFGALIVRDPPKKDPHFSLFDFDLSDHLMIIQDWTHTSSVSVFTSHHHGQADNKPPNILINGKGRYYGNVTELITSRKANRKPALLVSTTSSEFIGTTTQSTTTSDIDNTTEDTSTEETTTILEKDSTTSETVNTIPRKSQFPQVSAILKDNQRTKRSINQPTPESPMMPYEIYLVNPGSRYRFRTINAEFLNCPVEISIDRHNFTVIATDGYDFQPVEVSSLVTYAGERFDFIVKANQPVDNYWIRVKGLMDCDQRFTSAYQVAILRYRGAPLRNPPGQPKYNYTVGPGIQLNALNRGVGEEKTLSIAELNSIGDKQEPVLRRDPDYKFFVYYDFYPKDNPLFHVQDLYGFQQVAPNKGRVFTPQLNHISLRFPSLPLMPAKDKIDQNTLCNETSLAAQGINCREEFCQCTHVLQVPLLSLVEVIIVDEGLAYDANHPIHLHGMPFRVVGMERLNNNVTIEGIRELDRLGRLKRKLLSPALKDTITVPDGGYTIIRFIADNPGYHLMHCHIEFHSELGMALVFKVGEHNQMQATPANFPTCGDYMPTSDAVIGASSNSLSSSISLSPIIFLLIILRKLI